LLQELRGLVPLCLLDERLPLVQKGKLKKACGSFTPSTRQARVGVFVNPTNGTVVGTL
jgi:hypothetical protein